MYIGRIVSVARTAGGMLCAIYRVSSRSFPNRTAVVGDDKVSIVPKPGHEGDVQKNPYIAYNCARAVCDGTVAVLTNGSQTDPIAEKMAQGVPARDALALASLALDYEKDQYNTPRISAVIDRDRGEAWLATVRADGLEVRNMTPPAGRFFYVATYEECRLDDTYSGDFTVDTPEAACDFILTKDVFASRTKPVSAVAALAAETGFVFAARDFTTES